MVVDFCLLDKVDILNKLFKIGFLNKILAPYKLIYIMCKDNKIILCFINSQVQSIFVKFEIIKRNNRFDLLVKCSDLPEKLKDRLNIFLNSQNLFLNRRILLEGEKLQYVSLLDLSMFNGQNFKNILARYYDIDLSGTKQKKTGIYESEKNYLYFKRHKDDFFPFYELINKYKLNKIVPVPRLSKNKLNNSFGFLKGELIVSVNKVNGQTGEQYFKKNYNSAALTDLVEQIIKLHSTKYDLIWSVPREIKSNLFATEFNSEQLSKLFKMGICHFDLHLNNLIFAKDKLAAILDLEKTDYGFIIEDLVVFFLALIRNNQFLLAQKIKDMYTQLVPEMIKEFDVFKNNYFHLLLNQCPVKYLKTQKNDLQALKKLL